MTYRPAESVQDDGVQRLTRTGPDRHFAAHRRWLQLLTTLDPYTCLDKANSSEERPPPGPY
jgi:hypothetical protein